MKTKIQLPLKIELGDLSTLITHSHTQNAALCDFQEYLSLKPTNKYKTSENAQGLSYLMLNYRSFLCYSFIYYLQILK